MRPLRAIVLAAGALALAAGSALATTRPAPVPVRAQVQRRVLAAGHYRVTVRVANETARREAVVLRIGPRIVRLVLGAHGDAVVMRRVRLHGPRLLVSARARRSAPRLRVEMARFTPARTASRSHTTSTTGSTGATGSTGSTTVTGSTGSTGSTGATGSTAATGTTGAVLFDGSSLSSWVNQSAAPTRVAAVADPDGSGDSVFQFTTENADVYPLTPTENPRSQLITPTGILQAGGQYWESYEVYLPASFPTVTSWVQLGEPVYGAPFDGSPPLALTVDDGAFTGDPAGEFRWQDGPYESVADQVLWDAPVVSGQWVRVTWHFEVAADGFAELLINDVEVASQSPFTVLDGSNLQGPWFSALNVYYAAGEFSSATAYFKGFRIATTQQAAES